MRNRHIPNRNILDLDSPSSEAVPIHHRPVPSPSCSSSSSIRSHSALRTRNMDHATRFTFHGLRVHPGPHRLRGIKKEITPSEHVRFIGETNDSHCDRFWAKALRQEATRHTCEVGAEVGW